MNAKLTKAQQSLVDTLFADFTLFVDEFAWDNATSYVLRVEDESFMGGHVRDLNKSVVAKLIELGVLVERDTETAYRHTHYVLAEQYRKGE